MDEQNKLLEKAHQIREKLRQIEEGKISEKELETAKEADAIRNQFLTDFVELYFLLGSSEATVRAKVIPETSKKSIIISRQGKQAEIYYEKLGAVKHKWSYRGKDFIAGNSNNGLTDEEKLIVTIADALS